MWSGGLKAADSGGVPRLGEVEPGWAGQRSKIGVTNSNPPEGVAGQLDKDILYTSGFLFTSSSHFKGRESYPRVPPLPYSTCRTRGISTHEGPWIPSLPSRRHL